MARWIERLTPGHFEHGEEFDREAFDALKEGLKRQRRDIWKFPVFVLGGLLLSVLLSSGIEGFMGNMLGVLSIFAGLILANLSTLRSIKAVKQARQRLGIKQKDVNAALRKVRQAERQQTVRETFAPFAGEGVDEAAAAALMAAIRKRKNQLWQIPLPWIAASVVVAIFALLIGRSIPNVHFASHLTSQRIVYILILIAAVTASLSWRRRTDKRIAAAAGKAGIAPEAAVAALRLAQDGGSPVRKGRMLTVLLIAIALYILLFLITASEATSDLGGFLFLGLSLAGIAGAILVYRKHPAGRWLALLPAALCMAGSLLPSTFMQKEMVMWMTLGVFFLIPYFLLRYLLYRNGMDKPFGKYLVGGAYVLLVVALIVQLGGKKYRMKSQGVWGISMVQSMDGKWGFYHIYKDREIIPCIYDAVKPFDMLNSQHSSEERMMRTKACLNGKWGVIDEEGRERIAFKYEEIGDIDSVMTARMDGKWGLIDHRGREISSFVYEIFGKGDNLLPARLNGKWGLIGLNGREVAPFVYDSIKPFYIHNKDIYVRSDGKWGAIDRKGNELVPCQYDTYQLAFQANIPPATASTPAQTPSAQTVPAGTTMKIANIDRTRNTFDFVDAASGEKIVYRRLIIHGVEPVDTRCIVKEGTEMVQFVVRGRQELSRRTDGTQTVITYAGENTVTYSAYAQLKYKLNNGTLTILGMQ